MTPVVLNPMNQLARIAVGLLAIYWGVRGLLEVVEAITTWWSLWTKRDGGDLMEGFRTLGFVSLFALLFAVFPASLLYRVRDVVAGQLAPINDPSPPLAIRGSEALSVGCMLLAVYLGIGGVTGLLSALSALGMVTLFALPRGNELHLSTDVTVMRYGAVAISSGISLGAGWLLWRYARALSAKLPT